jgi:cob(I)alamin adenosyltransferase
LDAGSFAARCCARLAERLALALAKTSDALSSLGRRVVLARIGDLVFVTFGALAGIGALLGFG